MVHRKRLVLIFLFLALIAGAIALKKTRSNHRLGSELAQTTRAMTKKFLKFRSNPLVGSSGQENDSGSITMSELRNVAVAIDFKRDSSTEVARQLEVLAQGLRSSDETIRTNTEDLARNVLTFWLRTTPEDDWHNSAEIDDFFRILAANKSLVVRRFLESDPTGPEQRYLNQI